MSNSLVGLRTIIEIRDGNEGLRRVHNHGEGLSISRAFSKFKASIRRNSTKHGKKA